MESFRHISSPEWSFNSDNSDNLDLENIDNDKDEGNPREKKIYNEKGQLTFDGTIVFNDNRWKNGMENLKIIIKMVI